MVADCTETGLSFIETMESWRGMCGVYNAYTFDVILERSIGRGLIQVWVVNITRVC